ncbi:MAG: GxxExxY protein [Gracilimonas sp.]|uniref:GxxExxY protein n=1 Tax=Gracilimonas TaxID=649462 RepID=UPI001B1FDC5D|nr:GxxExxY protein [Gracilimonas sp.]MBO6585193.1 GxxExxY protein [Gracilimonas sp.]MBO6615535.1 GxxExxY protein [Gracilimonas sp.]
MIENELSKIIIGTCIEIHRELGPGLLESVYEEVLFSELNEKGLHVQRQVSVPLLYKEMHFETAYRLDLLVNNRVIIEIKAVESLAPVHYSQLLTYLKLSNKKLGLLINFNVKLLKEGIHRVVNKL